MDETFLEVPLTRGKMARISPQDAERVMAHKWCATPAKSGLWYAVRGITVGGKKTTQGMHRFILGCRGQVDHKDGDGLNNQRDNLQEASSSLNNHRRHVCKSNSGFYGVSKHSQWGGFCAYLTLNKKTNYLGIFKTPEDAARRYDEAAKQAHGEAAMLNFPA